MLIFPAIDLMDGQVVRLRQGKAEEKTVYSSDPVAFARRWAEEGGDYLHIVDLDAAFTGEQKNLAWIAKIAAAIGIPCQLGGGIRDEAAAQRAFDAGVARVIIGTRAAESLDFITRLAEKFGSGRIAVGIDSKNGLVSVKGWTEMSTMKASTLAVKAEEAGAGTIICTDIATDGMLAGPNIAEIERIMGLVRCNVIASGGVSTVEDVKRLAAIPGLYGAIIGKALYDNRIRLDDLAA
ncbi:MAG TPA: 1-(5-phosphoribosyl)-5-[(5-phosphoribosylamino)methylideneamino]imidazole-4-carboxamide isomerase [Chthoniobacteraceae bacterium]|jgi:phosphoribosylformimino-5-aminoimidazole carboxamide ribotide isomerase|nr:1-(5-phosphoribosyl)-5-[(5-phosphoribosylamino)methylideneamino]imidazole-4-carboxamide isomerase [Chthoniobacteraceae bacterium]